MLLINASSTPLVYKGMRGMLLDRILFYAEAMALMRKLAGNEGVETNMEITVMDYIGTTSRMHSFIPS